jgi:hypothetical protein
MKATKEYYAKVNRARKAKERAEKRYNDLWKKNWIDLLVRPIALQLAKKFPNRTMGILGPFGIECEVAIHFNKKGVDESRLFDVKGWVKSITFRPGDLDNGGLHVVNYKKDTGRYARGTIGWMNGMNYNSVPLTEKNTINDLLKYVH